MARQPHVTFTDCGGRVWPCPWKPKRSRFAALRYTSPGYEIRHFPTRRAAVEWLDARHVPTPSSATEGRTGEATNG